MLWLSIAWRNLWRNRNRTLLQVSAIAGSLVLAIWVANLNAGVYSRMIEDAARVGSGHIGLYHRDYQANHRVGDTVPANALLPRLMQDPEVVAVYPRLRLGGLVRSSHDSRPAALIGLDLAKEQPVNPLLASKHLIAGKWPSAGLTPGVLLGERLADELQVKAGKKAVLMLQNGTGQIASELVRVSGILRTGVSDVDGGAVFMDRGELAKLIGRPGSAHELAIVLKDVHQVPAALPHVQAIAQAYPEVSVLTWDRAMPSLSSGINLKFKSQRAMFSILYLLVAIGTMSTLLMSVMERTREFGVLRAIGVGHRAIRQMILLEATVLGLLGSGLGLVLATGISYYTATKGLDMSSKLKNLDFGGVAIDPVMHSGWDPGSMFWLSVGMVLLTVVASLYPIYWTLKIRPADAMRTY